MDNARFEHLLSVINQETGSCEKKLEILYNSRGFFGALQASRMLYAFGIPSDKLRAIRIMEPRLCRMTCSEARDVIGSVSIHNDKLKVLEHVKRYLMDYQTREGQECILSAFPFEQDKVSAMRILYTVRSDVFDATPAGGHQGYAALGGLYTQCRPLVPHLYGTVEEQWQHAPAHGPIEIPVTAKAGVLPSMYTGHPSYAYPPGRDYATDRGYPGNSKYSEDPNHCVEGSYPTGAPPLGMHQGGPAPTGFA